MALLLARLQNLISTSKALILVFALVFVAWNHFLYRILRAKQIERLKITPLKQDPVLFSRTQKAAERRRNGF